MSLFLSQFEERTGVVICSLVPCSYWSKRGDCPWLWVIAISSDV